MNKINRLTLILIVLIACFFAVNVASASDGGAQAVSFGPFIDSGDDLYRGIVVKVYAAGTTNAKRYWTDESKTTAVDSGTLTDSDDDGIVFAYFDGDYRFQVKQSDGSTALDDPIDWDNFKATSDTATLWENNQGTSYPSVVTNNTWQLAVKKDGSGNFDELGINDGTAFRTLIKKKSDDSESYFDGVAVESKPWFDVTHPTYGATGDGSTDDTTAVAAAITAANAVKGVVVFPVGIFRVTTKLEPGTGVILKGVNRYTSIIKIDADIDGIEIHRHNGIEDLFIQGTANVGTDKSLLVIGTSGSDSARSWIKNVIVGNLSTQLDCDGITAVNAFIFTMDTVYIVNCDWGFKTADGTTSVFNAASLVNVETHFCNYGMLLSRASGVSMVNVASEGNEYQGIIIGEARGLFMSGVYLEGNNIQAPPTGTAAEIVIDSDNTAYTHLLGTDPSGAVSISGIRLVNGSANSTHGLYVGRHRNVEINGLLSSGDYSTAEYLVGDDAISNGSISNVWAGGGTETVSNDFWTRQNAGTFFTLSGTTSSIAAAASEDLFTPTVGSMWYLMVRNSQSSSGLYWAGFAIQYTGPAVGLDTISNGFITLADNSGAIQLTNGHGNAQVYVWSAIRIQ